MLFYFVIISSDVYIKRTFVDLNKQFFLLTFTISILVIPSS